MYDTSLWLGGKEFKSRLIVGTGKYPSFENMREAIEASGAEIVTVAVRRVSLPGQGESLLDYIDTKRYTLLPNTAGCYTADEAVRTCYLAREAGLGDAGQARGHRRLAHALPRRRGAARGHAHARPRGLHGAALHQRRPGHGQEARGRRRGRRHAAGRAHRLGPRHPQPVQHQDHPRDRHRARSSSTRAWAPRRTPPSPWSWAATAC